MSRLHGGLFLVERLVDFKCPCSSVCMSLRPGRYRSCLDSLTPPGPASSRLIKMARSGLGTPKSKRGKSPTDGHGSDVGSDVRREVVARARPGLAPRLVVQHLGPLTHGVVDGGEERGERRKGVAGRHLAVARSFLTLIASSLYGGRERGLSKKAKWSQEIAARLSLRRTGNSKSKNTRGRWGTASQGPR